MTKIKSGRLLIVIKTGNSFDELVAAHGDFEHWIGEALMSSPTYSPTIRVIDPRHGAPLPALDEILGVVITGSHAMVTENSLWMERLEHWIRQLHSAKCPLLGICFGHQIIAKALGGEIDVHPKGAEVGTRWIHLQPAANDDPILSHLPPQFTAHTVHWQTVRRLPAQALLLASSSHEVHHAYRVGDSTWGVQFHPEFSASVMKGYLELLSERLDQEGQCPESLLNQVELTPHARQILPLFLEFAVRWSMRQKSQIA